MCISLKCSLTATVPFAMGLYVVAVGPGSLLTMVPGMFSSLEGDLNSTY